ncbi:MAG: flippase [Firmicutes bacterium HGW-Firmicutes-5]|nr:MAG: flippase [Firmicutes bacterium HGW-Firmicutes-5]
MSPEMNKSKVLSSLLWKLLERSGSQGIQFIVQIILARLLMPEEYGIITIVMVFILLANVFVQSGFNTALIQKKEVDEVDFSSIFFLSLGVATLLYGLIYMAAPFIAGFYTLPLLVPVLRVLSITLFIGALNSIQNAYVARNMLFKRLFISSIGAVIVSGIVGILAAYKGWGVWALVAQLLTNQVTITLILWFTVKWRPHLLFSLKRVKVLFAYANKLIASALIDTLYKDLSALIIAKMYAPSMLGFFNRGRQFPELIVANINGSIQSVMLPALSAHQDDKKRVKEMMRRAIVSSSFMIFPMMSGLAVVAKPLVLVLLTEKWLPTVPFLQIACFAFAIMPIHTANLQAINAMGRSDIFLKLELVKKTYGLIILGISLFFGVYGIAIGLVLNGVISSFVNAFPNKKLLNYSYKEQLKDIMPAFFISGLMGVMVYALIYLNLEPWHTLVLQIVSGIVIYIGLANLFHIESYYYLIATAKQLIKDRKR